MEIDDRLELYQIKGKKRVQTFRVSLIKDRCSASTISLRGRRKIDLITLNVKLTLRGESGVSWVWDCR